MMEGDKIVILGSPSPPTLLGKTVVSVLEPKGLPKIVLFLATLG